jgi:ribosome-associated toxin RatA of RatAB toxin-antitoxin module
MLNSVPDRRPERLQMADAVTERMTIHASKDACFDVLLDFERYPEWARDLKEVEVLERDEQGRGKLVRYRAAGMGYSTSYSLEYDYDDGDRMSWKLVDGDLVRQLDGCYLFTPVEGDDDAVEVEYQLTADLKMPLPGFVKRRTQLKIMHTAIRELKTRVEAQSLA